MKITCEAVVPPHVPVAFPEVPLTAFGYHSPGRARSLVTVARRAYAVILGSMDPAIAGALVGAGFTSLTAVVTQLTAARRENQRDATGRDAAKAQEVRDTLESAAMLLSSAIRRAGRALESPSTRFPLAEVGSMEGQKLVEELDTVWQLQARLALRLSPGTPTSAEYTRAADHLNEASQAGDQGAASRELDIAAAHRDKFLTAAADAFGTPLAASRH
jgi:hypothetical protein